MQAEKSSAGKLHTNSVRGKQTNKLSKGRASKPEITARCKGCLDQWCEDMGEAHLPSAIAAGLKQGVNICMDNHVWTLLDGHMDTFRWVCEIAWACKHVCASYGHPEQCVLGTSFPPSLLYLAPLPIKGANNLAIGLKSEEHEASAEHLSSESKLHVRPVSSWSKAVLNGLNCIREGSRYHQPDPRVSTQWYRRV